MIGLVLVTHGRLAEELRAAMEHVVGRQRHVATVCIGPDDDIEQRRADVARCIEEVDAGDGVVLLTDMFGGTPSNLAISQMDRKGVEVIAGVNLPMLVKFAKVRCDRLLADAVDSTESAGRKYIASASKALPSCRVSDATLPVIPLAAATMGAPMVNGAIGGCPVLNGPVNGAAANGSGVNGAPANCPIANAPTPLNGSAARIAGGKLNGTLG
jgi:PTS system mannose-specific IIA component